MNPESNPDEPMSLKSILGSSGLVLGSFWGRFWDRFGVGLGLFLIRFGMVLGSRIHPKLMKNRHLKTIRFQERFLHDFRCFLIPFGS